MKRTPKYECPEFLANLKVKQKDYQKWLQNRAAAHYKRDKGRIKNYKLSIAKLKERIHQAVKDSNGTDYYTGAMLDWKKINKYNNDKSSDGRHKYQKTLYSAPTVDHDFDRANKYNVRICARITNACKSTLKHSDFIEFCKQVIAHHNKRKQ